MGNPLEPGDRASISVYSQRRRVARRMDVSAARRACTPACSLTRTFTTFFSVNRIVATANTPLSVPHQSPFDFISRFPRSYQRAVSPVGVARPGSCVPTAPAEPEPAEALCEGLSAGRWVAFTCSAAFRLAFAVRDAGHNEHGCEQMEMQSPRSMIEVRATSADRCAPDPLHLPACRTRHPAALCALWLPR